MWTLTFVPIGLSLLIAFIGSSRLSKGVFLLLCWTFAVVFSVVYGGRDLYSGTDSYAYATTFEVMGGGGHWEIGFYLWMEFLRFFSHNYKFFFLATALVQSVLIAYSAVLVRNRHGDAYAVVILVLSFYSFAVFDLYTNGMRQGLALGFAIFSISCFIDKKIIISFIFMMFSSLIHYSFFIIFSFYILWTLFPLIKSKFIIIFTFFIVLTLSIFVMIGLNTFSYLVDVIGLSFLPENTGYKVLSYSEMVKGSYSELNSLGRLKIWLYFVPIFTLVLFFARTEKEFELCGMRFVAAGGLFCVSIYLLMSYQAYSYRYLYLLSAFFPFVIVFCLETFEKRYRIFDSGVGLLGVVLVSGVSYGFFVLIRSNLTSFNYTL
jgi:hypothetical protein